MPDVRCTREIAASAATVWDTVGDFAAVGRYVPTVVKLELEGERGPGQIRRLTLDDGSLTVSRCTALDDEALSVSYEILETELPLDDYSSTQDVHPLAENRCELRWTSQFEPRGVTVAEAVSYLEGAIESGLDVLARQFE